MQKSWTIANVDDERNDCVSLYEYKRNRTKPSLKLQAFFRRHFNNVTFIEGTVLDVSTLRLAKVGAEFTDIPV